MKIAIPLALLTLAIGIGAGIVLSRDRERRASPEGEVRPGEPAIVGAPAGNDDRLVRLESEVAELRAEVERLREPGPSPELKRGDLVLSVDGLDDLTKFREHVTTVPPEEWISIRVRRGDVEEVVRVKGRSIQISMMLPRR